MSRRSRLGLTLLLSVLLHAALPIRTRIQELLGLTDEGWFQLEHGGCQDRGEHLPEGQRYRFPVTLVPGSP